MLQIFGTSTTVPARMVVQGNKVSILTRATVQPLAIPAFVYFYV